MNSLQSSAFNLAPPPTLQWQPVQISSFTARAGRAYPCNTTSAAFTVTLPASASAGDQITITDYAGTFQTNALTINPNGLKIQGEASSISVGIKRASVDLVYVDATQGWVVWAGFAVASLGEAPTSVEYVVVGGGGGGGNGGGGGGGAGGYRTDSSFSVAKNTSYTVTIGAGGAGKSTASNGSGAIGNDSVFSTITSYAGGYGGGGQSFASGGSSSASGGGGGGAGSGTAGAGTGNSPSQSPQQGNSGGTGYASPGVIAIGGGGGGSNLSPAATGGNAQSSSPYLAGNGGAGTASTITGSSMTHCGGGGGGLYSTGGTVGSGGAGGGGNGASNTNPGNAGTANLGGGGGGGGGTGGGGGNGGAGVVIIAYSNIYASLASVGAGLTCNGSAGNTTPDTSSRPGYKVYTFTNGTGSISW